MSETMSAFSNAAVEQTSRPLRPNYRRLHAKPLPLDTFPLPPLIPHNPFCLLQTAYVYLSHLAFPPKSHNSNLVHGMFSPETNSVHVTDAASIRLLWERGFFGKGSLSRSEPTWLDREKKRVGLLATDTSEEYTQQRREERRKMKMERARKEREAIEEKLVQEREDALDLDPAGSHGEVYATKDEPVQSKCSDAAPENNGPVLMEFPSALSNSQLNRDSAAESTVTETTAEPILNGAAISPEAMKSPIPEMENQEHLQLNAEEAFFLSYALGILHIYDRNTNLLFSNPELMTLFRSHSHFPPLSPSSVIAYDPFLPSYAAYHHFRSLGWVVRPGIKFAVDWLLYLRGPTFAHAEFAVLVLPAFRDSYWWDEARRKETEKREKRDWWWLHCVQRVQAQVRKGLVICWVEIPPPGLIARAVTSGEERKAAEAKGIEVESFDIGRVLKQYKVRDMVIKRWIPNRSRD